MQTIQDLRQTISAMMEVRRLLGEHIKQCELQIGDKVKELQAMELAARDTKELDTAKESMRVAKTLGAKKKTTRKKTK